MPIKRLKCHNVYFFPSWNISTYVLQGNPKKNQPVHYTISSKPKKNECFLDPHHSHFILVDDGSVHKFGGEIKFRADLEKKISYDEVSGTGA